MTFCSCVNENINTTNNAISISSPSYQAGQEEGWENWVTVFGFPPSSMSAVLAVFSRVGRLLEQRCPPRGNWVHLRYYSRVEAQRALAHHGRVLAGTTMIGVLACREPPPPSSFNSTPTPSTPSRGGAESCASQLDLYNSPYMSPGARGARPLSVGRQNTVGNVSQTIVDNEVLADRNTPTKRTGAVSKTLDYLFGWG